MASKAASHVGSQYFYPNMVTGRVYIILLVVVDFFFFHFQNDRSILRDDQPSCIPNAMFMFSVKCFCHLFEG